MFQFRVWHGDFAGVIGLPLAHPLYVLLAWVWSFLPLGDFAFRVNLFSSLCGAVALGFCLSLLINLTRNRAAALTATILLGVSHTFWWHAVVAEVYDLYAVGLLAELWLLEKFISRKETRWLQLAAFVNGLNLSNHLLAILHWPAYAGLIGWALYRRRLVVRELIFVIAALLLGSTPYLWLIIAQIAKGHGMFDTLKEALVGPPQRANIVLTHKFPFVGQIKNAISYFALNFPTPLALLAPVGLWAAWKDRERRWFALIAGSIFVVGFVFAFRYLVPDQFVFYMPCYVLFALFSGLGVARIVAGPGRLAGVCIASALLPILVYEEAPGILSGSGVSIGLKREIPYRDGYAYFIRPRKNGDDGAERFAREALEQAGPDGILIADVTISNVLAYVRDIKGVGRGVTIGLPADVAPAGPAIWADEESVRPFAQRGAAYICSGTAPYVPAWVEDHFELERAGVVFRIRPRPAPL